MHAHRCLYVYASSAESRKNMCVMPRYQGKGVRRREGRGDEEAKGKGKGKERGRQQREAGEGKFMGRAKVQCCFDQQTSRKVQYCL